MRLGASNRLDDARPSRRVFSSCFIARAQLLDGMFWVAGLRRSSIMRSRPESASSGVPVLRRRASRGALVLGRYALHAPLDDHRSVKKEYGSSKNLYMNTLSF